MSIMLQFLDYAILTPIIFPATTFGEERHLFHPFKALPVEAKRAQVHDVSGQSKHRNTRQKNVFADLKQCVMVLNNTRMCLDKIGLCDIGIVLS